MPILYSLVDDVPIGWGLTAREWSVLIFAMGVLSLAITMLLAVFVSVWLLPVCWLVLVVVCTRVSVVWIAQWVLNQPSGTTARWLTHQAGVYGYYPVLDRRTLPTRIYLD